METIYKEKSKLKSKGSDGKVAYSIPSSDQVGALISDFQDWVAILPKFLAFAQQEAKEYAALKSFPITQSDIDGINKTWILPRHCLTANSPIMLFVLFFK